MRINPPDLNSRRARFADWLELLALTNAGSEISLSAIRSHLRRLTNDRMSPKDIDIDADDNGEQEVTDRVSDDLEERITEEIELRSRSIGLSYPFALVYSGIHGAAQILRRKPTWNNIKTGEMVYVFCILDSGIRDGLVEVTKKENNYVKQIGNMFQICSCIAVGGYTNAEVVSFGFPRATGDGFLPALKAAWSRYGSYKIHDEIPYPFDTNLKDGGVDIIAWRSFSDGNAATFLMFVQVASGLGWKGKAVVNDVKAIRNWFVHERFEHFLPAICIPFPLWFDVDEPPKSATRQSLAYKDGIKRQFALRETVYGVIFDRGRIAQSCALVLGLANGPPATIDGADRIDDVSNCVVEVMAELAEQRAVE